MNKKNAEIKPFGEQAFLIEWSNEINHYNHTQVNALNKLIQDRFSQYVIATTPAYQSLAIYLKKGVDTSFLIESINQVLTENTLDSEILKRKIHIPVCYDKQFGIDLENLSQSLDLSTESIIAHHTKPIYPVYFIGFLPGFPYLEGLNPLIAFPRKEKPRSVIKAGSVGIAENQTGIYPMDSPGGWNIIGRSPISFFNIENQSPSLLKTGDSIQFFAISKEEYDNIKNAVIEGTYELKITDIDD